MQRACPRTPEQTQRRNHLKQALDRRLRDGGVRSDSLVVPTVDEEVNRQVYVFLSVYIPSSYPAEKYQHEKSFFSYLSSL